MEEKPAEESRKFCQSKLSKLVLLWRNNTCFLLIQLLFFFEKCFLVGGLNLGQFLIGLGVGSAAAMVPQLEASVKKYIHLCQHCQKIYLLFHRTNTAER